MQRVLLVVVILIAVAAGKCVVYQHIELNEVKRNLKECELQKGSYQAELKEQEEGWQRAHKYAVESCRRAEERAADWLKQRDALAKELKELKAAHGVK